MELKMVSKVKQTIKELKNKKVKMGKRRGHNSTAQEIITVAVSALKR